MREIWSSFRQWHHKRVPVNWAATLYFNFKIFPFAIARKFPVLIYRSVRITGFQGKITINHPVSKGMLSFGKPFELFSRPMKIAELGIQGELVLNGRARIGADSVLFVAEGAKLEIGDLFRMGSRCKLICTDSISIGESVSISYESQLFDSDFHAMKNTLTGDVLPMSHPVEIGSHNFFANRVSILPGTKTPDFCTVASNSVCVKDYTEMGTEILIGGVPAKLLRTNLTRDWEGEQNYRQENL